MVKDDWIGRYEESVLMYVLGAQEGLESMLNLVHDQEDLVKE